MKKHFGLFMICFALAFWAMPTDFGQIYSDDVYFEVVNHAYARSSSRSYGSSSRSYGGSSKSYGSSSKSYGSSSSKKSSWGNKKSSSTYSSSSKKEIPKTRTKEVTIPPKTTKKTGTFSSGVNKGVSKSKSSTSYKNYKYSKNLGKGNPVTVSSRNKTRATSIYSSSPNRKTFSSRDDYYRHRDSYYTSRNYTPPIYVSSARYSSYGMYDGLFLWMMLDNIHDSNNRSMMYNHYNDPGMQAWRVEADRLAASNADLQKKLAALDVEMQGLNGTPRDPNYMPKGVDPSIVLASTVVTESIPEEKSSNAIWWFVGSLLLVGVIGIVWYLW